MKNKKCKNDATHRYTWPGKDEAVACETHINGIRAIASAIGMRLQTIPLSEEDRKIGLKCSSSD
ncbi:MAG: hypothetical protein A2031_08090 [Deltaproteobacteria bacterium RBG_19FT_COMBO_43_11]|nr:MAG: hypothetical protein A2031_08090 [Deltaproteobacteria bacterium RBG_19FT_COMBO_43_11]